MKKVHTPKLTIDQATNAEVLVEVRFLDWPEGETGYRVCEDRYQLRQWDRRVPEVRDITTNDYGAAPGSRVAIVVSISTMDGQTHHVHTETGRVAGWEGMSPTSPSPTRGRARGR